MKLLIEIGYYLPGITLVLQQVWGERGGSPPVFSSASTCTFIEDFESNPQNRVEMQQITIMCCVFQAQSWT